MKSKSKVRNTTVTVDLDGETKTLHCQSCDEVEVSEEDWAVIEEMNRDLSPEMQARRDYIIALTYAMDEAEAKMKKEGKVQGKVKVQMSRVKRAVA